MWQKNIERVGANWSIAFRKEYTSKKHWHDEMEILYGINGMTRVTINEHIYDVGKGETLIIPSGCVHRYFSCQDANYAILVIRHTGVYLDALDIETRKQYENLYSCILHLNSSETLNKTFLHLYSVLENLDKSIVLESAILMSIFELAELVCSSDDIVIAREQAKVSCNSDGIEKMRNYIREHIDEKITLSDIAKYLGFSDNYCSKYIKKKTNMNYLEYLNNERVEAAQHMLRDSDDSITEIAYKSGFTSIQSFNRVFKSYSGISPTSFRTGTYVKK